jgi:hypothetical protein
MTTLLASAAETTAMPEKTRGSRKYDVVYPTANTVKIEC